MSVPSGIGFALLALATFRIWWLLAEDTILDRPRAWLLGAPGWKPEHGDPPPTYRKRLATFLTCPWCAGFWLSLLVWGLWLALPNRAVLIAATPFALSAIVGLLAGLRDGG